MGMRARSRRVSAKPVSPLAAWSVLARPRASRGPRAPCVENEYRSSPPTVETRRVSDMNAFRGAVTAWAAGGSGDPARELAGRLSVRTVVLLEGLSDAAAVGALAARDGRDLAAEGVCVLPMGGAMNVGRFSALLGPRGLGLRLTGLCDERELGHYARGWRRAGAGGDGVFVCAADLEDELIRALGVERVTELVREQGTSVRCAPSCGSPRSGAGTRAAAPPLPRHQEGPQDPLRPDHGRGAGRGAGARAPGRSARRSLTAGADAAVTRRAPEPAASPWGMASGPARAVP